MNGLDAIRQREQAATEGPWEVDGRDDYVRGPDPARKRTTDLLATVYDRENTPFIAASRTDVPLLLAVVDVAVDVAINGNRRMVDLIAALAPLLEPVE